MTKLYRAFLILFSCAIIGLTADIMKQGGSMSFGASMIAVNAAVILLHVIQIARG